MKALACLVGFFVFGAASVSFAAADPAPGECASGFCGTPANNGGGGCGCGGGSILVNFTDLGKTYSGSDDWDSDGFEDDFDNCPFMPNRDQADSDNDGVGDVCDNAPTNANPNQSDIDGDGIGDVADPDRDGDGVANAQDNCPDVKNVAQTNTDGAADGGDACDSDDDNDTFPDATDTCPLIANADQNTTPTGGECNRDSDVDGVLDSIDNCPAASNVDQLDTDKDGEGDACDADADNDGIPNNADNCARVPNKDQADADKDGAGDACDPNGFCFIASKNRDAKCLDPQSIFQVTAAPRAQAGTGELLPLSMYANLESASIKYTFTVKGPEGSRATVTYPRGTVQTSNQFEYQFQDTTRPTFTPDVAGSYTIEVSAELAQSPSDYKYPEAVRAVSTTTIDVSGPARQLPGCSATGVELAPVAAAIALLLRRRRR